MHTARVWQAEDDALELALTGPRDKWQGMSRVLRGQVRLLRYHRYQVKFSIFTCIQLF